MASGCAWLARLADILPRRRRCATPMQSALDHTWRTLRDAESDRGQCDRAACPPTSVTERPMMKLRGLCAITDNAWTTAACCPLRRAAPPAAPRLLQCRDKSSDQARRACASRKPARTTNAGAQLIVNDDAELATRLGVGLHLSQPTVRCRRARAFPARPPVIGAPPTAQLELSSRRWPRSASYEIAFDASSIQHRTGAPAASVELLDQASRACTCRSPPSAASIDTAPGLIARGVDRHDHALFAAASRRRGGTPRPRQPQRPVRTCLTPPRLAER